MAWPLARRLTRSGRADLLERSGDAPGAARAYETAAGCADNDVGRAQLQRRARQLAV